MLSIHNSLPELNKSWIVCRLRHYMLLFQIIMVCAAFSFFNVKVPVFVFLAILLYGLATVLIHFRFLKNQKSRPWHIPLFLMSDFVFWYISVALSGGYLNPLIVMVLMPAIFMSVYAENNYFIILIVLVVSAISSLYFFTPSIFPMPHMKEFPAWYLAEYGITHLEMIKFNDITAISTAAFFAMLSLHVMRREILKYAAAQSSSSKVYQEYTRAAAIGTMAAAAVHELGTPLNTIHLIATELVEETADNAAVYDDVKILVQQTERCRNILKKLAKIDYSENKSGIDILGVSILMEQMAAPYAKEGIRFKVNVNNISDKDTPKISWVNEWTYAICNVLQNAFQFAKSRVTVTLDVVKNKLIITVSDDGKGFSRKILETVGEPYVSDRGTDEKGSHMGLGLFIATGLMEQTGGSVEFSNNLSGGACVTIVCKL